MLSADTLGEEIRRGMGQDMDYMNNPIKIIDMMVHKIIQTYNKQNNYDYRVLTEDLRFLRKIVKKMQQDQNGFLDENLSSIKSYKPRKRAIQFGL